MPPRRRSIRSRAQWQAVSLNGQNLPNGVDMTLSFSGDKYENWVNGALDERGTVKIDPSTKPASIDFVIIEGDDAGKTQLGLVEVNGDSLILSFASPGNPTGRRPRPTPSSTPSSGRRSEPARSSLTGIYFDPIYLGDADRTAGHPWHTTN